MKFYVKLFNQPVVHDDQPLITMRSVISAEGKAERWSKKPDHYAEIWHGKRKDSLNLYKSFGVKPVFEIYRVDVEPVVRKTGAGFSEVDRNGNHRFYHQYDPLWWQKRNRDIERAIEWDSWKITSHSRIAREKLK